MSGFLRALKRLWSGGDEAAVLAEALLGESGALAGFIAPVAIVHRDGSVLAANDAADRLRPVVGTGGKLASTLEKTIAAGDVVTETIVVKHDLDSDSVWELTVVPVVSADAAIVIGRDASHEQALRNALVDSRRRYKDLVEISSDFAWETGPDGRFIFVSPAGALGRAGSDCIGREPAEFVVEGMAPAAAALFSARAPVAEVDLWMTRADGAGALILASAVPVTDPDGNWCGARGICRDITVQHDRDVALAVAETRERLIAYIVRSMRDEIDPRHMLGAAAGAVAKALGGSCCRIFRVVEEGRFSLAAAHGTMDAPRDVEYRMLLSAAEQEGCLSEAAGGWNLMGIATSYRKNVNGAVFIARAEEPGPWREDDRGLFADVAIQLAIAIEQYAFSQKLEALSRTDELTGLLNRRAFFAELEVRISRIETGSGSGSLFFVDLDNFKAVNDAHGHKRGDDALLAVATMLAGNTRAGDLVARLGGDEFALWLDRTDTGSADMRACEVLDSTGQLAAYSGAPDKPLGISIGIAVYAAGSRETVAALVARADAAMYEIKHAGKGGYVMAAPGATGDVATMEPARP